MPVNSQPNPNASLSMSAAGYAQLRTNEGVVMGYYNDAPQNGNCTWGVGTLAHLGPCTAEELQRTVTPDQVDAVLRARVQDAERKVRATVNAHALTQAQFDAAVSFAYNSATANTRTTLAPANRGDMAAVAAHMARNVMVTPRDSNGRPSGPARLSRGLVARRRRESAPFRTQAVQR
ncbi:lysozyme [Burkholderia gladioli]|uniref:lysozyme n=1 Tax=Burkholderia gladioli TaxID=28095 RepID=UPI000BBD20F2|nr:glycoside hydrolase family protein [Burkholderia gladioli]ATF90537.1 lysozyme [Burkholderia gladioli pv. gladioli]MBJ9711335.1 glycoside hydrolase family protein [Burkholderia gladioli]MDN7499609.1 glycoside hydrolase family protein [Burkholderia gladioli]MDR8086129.1 glycoside hydrolase family protein [Burkholderia gladioli]MDZ4041431.1 glycoside hydrolase family protein [Burkholderia gladioli pv. alliicola]